MSKTWPYITGERLQELADVTILTDPIRRFHKNLARLPIRQALFGGGMGDLVVDRAEQLEPVKEAEVIFVYTHLLEAFFEKIVPRLTRPFILMSHNSDHVVDGRFVPYLADPRLFKWFAQNTAADHKKLVPLPLGVANSQWAHGRLDLLHRAAYRKGPKTGFVYMNFDARTNPAQRQPVFDRLKNHPLVTVSAGLGYEAYLNELASHHFCICPPGNGLDCHRIWECFYLGVIPVVSSECRLRGFDSLPILYVDDWGRLDADFLKDAYRQMARRPVRFERADLGHWRSVIDRERRILRRTQAGCDAIFEGESLTGGPWR
ncbi:MAG: hypothetical protein JEZ11_23370 [Desulfobacterales bacterium]|nr:hypothetical protein [Desulfobacterales bacterium]